MVKMKCHLRGVPSSSQIAKVVSGSSMMTAALRDSKRVRSDIIFEESAFIEPYAAEIFDTEGRMLGMFKWIPCRGEFLVMPFKQIEWSFS
jgi:hypothetical protein